MLPIVEDISKFHNFVFIGEAGCGKSEVSVNLAHYLLERKKEVHLFDLDMTKPLFRIRELQGDIEKAGICLHFEEQFEDAPVVVGGTVQQLKNPDSYAILDVGGDYIGARSIGGYAPYLNTPETRVLYLVNPYRPWSVSPKRISTVLSDILAVTHIAPDHIHFVANPYLGEETTTETIIEGYRKLCDIFESLDFICAEEHLADRVEASLPLPVLPIHRYIPEI